MESNAKNDSVIELLRDHYYVILCEGCFNYDQVKVFPRSGRTRDAKTSIVVKSPEGLQEARLYARSRSVDIVSFGSSNLKYLDESEIGLLSEFGKAIEIRVNELVSNYKALGRLRRTASLLINKEIAVSFTCSPASVLQICVPMQVLSFFENLKLNAEDLTVLWSLATNYVISKVEEKGMRKVLSGDR